MAGADKQGSDLRDVPNRRRAAANGSSTPRVEREPLPLPEELNPIRADGSWPAAEAPARAAARPEFRSAAQAAPDEESMLRAQRGEINAAMDNILPHDGREIASGREGCDSRVCLKQLLDCQLAVWSSLCDQSSAT